MKKYLIALPFLITMAGYAQVDTTFIFNTDRPYGTLDIRIATSPTRYYYLQEGVTFSLREVSPGVPTESFRDMTPWDSSPYFEGNLRLKNGSSDAFAMNYRLLFPNEYQLDFPDGYPMIVMMHGAGERGNCWDEDCYWGTRSWNPSSNNPAAPTTHDHLLLNNDHNLSHGGSQHLEARNRAGSRLPGDSGMPQRAFPGFVLFPQNLNGWDTPSIHDAIRLIRLVVKKYNVDPNRIYVHGLSNGGIATYNLIKRAPWLFAAALPMSSPSDAAIINQGLLPAVVHIPIWTFQGGQDTAPTPSRTAVYAQKFREAGAEVRYSIYEHLGHGTWNTAYGEPEFFSWMRSMNKRNIHVFYGNTSICNDNGVRLGLADGFLAYQWQRNGATIAGATSNEYVAMQPGVYRARFSRISRTPSSTQWEEWSPPVTVTAGQSVKANMVALTTTHLRGPDNKTVNTITLKSASKADSYLWYKDGTRIDFPGNNLDDTVSMLTITGTSTGRNGVYSLKTAGFGGCESEPSDPLNLFFSNSAPFLADSNIPTSFRQVSSTGSSITLAWNDRSSIETAYEIWRRAPEGNFEFAGRTLPNAVTFTDSGLNPSTTYEYKIRALNNAGRSRYAPDDDRDINLSATTDGDTSAPTAPQNLAVVRNSISSISLSWTASTDNNGAISHYVVYYGSESQVTSSPAPEYTLTGLPSNESFQITVKAVDNAGLFSPASNPIAATTIVTGLWYGHSTGAWTSLDDIDTWTQPEFTGWVPNFTLSPRTQDDYFNFEFNGYLFVQQAGNYYFYLNSDDGSRLYIDGNPVVDFDGIHGRSVANEGFGVRSPSPVNLAAGPHEIRVIYMEYTSGQSLDVAYQGADTGNERMRIPDAALTSGSGTVITACAGSGSIVHELWTGISGTMISSIPVFETPDQSSLISVFEAPQNIDDNYGTRIRGYVCPPVSGIYTFWISGNDKTELWLSTSEDPADKQRIAYADHFTNVRQWNKYTTQQSGAISLQANQRYYIEALHKEGVGTDHVAVGWQLPDGTFERPIQGVRLIPFNESPGGEGMPAAMNTFADLSDAGIQVFPNPADGGTHELKITTTQKWDDARLPVIEIQRITGEVVYSGQLVCDGNCSNYSIPFGDFLTPGVYIVNVLSGADRATKRLLVK